MNSQDIDLNLLRVFEAVYRVRSISRAAALLGLSQPATSHAVTRLRLALRDPLFIRSATGMQPTERAERLVPSVQAALAQLDLGLNDDDTFDPRTSAAEVRLHLTDIGERRFLPRLMGALHERAPALRVITRTWNSDVIASSLLSGQLHFAIGYLPGVIGTAKLDLFTDRYVLLVREGHPLLAGRSRQRVTAVQLNRLNYITVHSHAQTTRILEKMGVEHRVRLEVSHFLALAATVRASELAAVVPREVANSFEPKDSFRLIEPVLPTPEFSVSLHWSRRHEQIPMMRWLKALIVELFGTVR